MSVTHDTSSAPSRVPRRGPWKPRLKTREEVLALRAQGLKLNAIAEQLGISKQWAFEVVNDPHGEHVRARKAAARRRRDREAEEAVRQ